MRDPDGQKEGRKEARRGGREEGMTGGLKEDRVRSAAAANFVQRASVNLVRVRAKFTKEMAPLKTLRLATV